MSGTKRRLTAEELVEYVEIQLAQGQRDAAIREVAKAMRAPSGSSSATDEASALKKRARALAWEWLRRAGDDTSERVQGMKDAHYELLELVGLWEATDADQPRPTTREENLAVAHRLQESLRIPAGFRVVVAATDRSGRWVGVSANVDDADTQAILRAALCGAERIYHDRPPTG